MVPHRQNNAEEHLSNAQDDGVLHLVRVDEGYFVCCQLPNGIEAERIRSADVVLGVGVWVELDCLVGLDAVQAVMSGQKGNRMVSLAA